MKFTPEEMAYDLPDELDFSKLIPIIGRGLLAAETQGGRALKVTYATVDDERVAFALDDGRKISAPLEWYPRLKYATPSQRNDWRLVLSGRAVVWCDLGLGISAKAMLEGVQSNEPAASLKKWIASRTTREQKRKAG